MASKKTVTVQILDQAITIATDASPERVKKVEDLVNRCLRDALGKSKTANPQQAAVLAALNIAEKYFDAIDKQAELKSRVVERSKKILGMLEGGKGHST